MPVASPCSAAACCNCAPADVGLCLRLLRAVQKGPRARGGLPGRASTLLQSVGLRRETQLCCRAVTLKAVCLRPALWVAAGTVRESLPLLSSDARCQLTAPLCVCSARRVSLPCWCHIPQQFSDVAHSMMTMFTYALGGVDLDIMLGSSNPEASIFLSLLYQFAMGTVLMSLLTGACVPAWGCQGRDEAGGALVGG